MTFRDILKLKLKTINAYKIKATIKEITHLKRVIIVLTILLG